VDLLRSSAAAAAAAATTPDQAVACSYLACMAGLLRTVRGSAESIIAVILPASPAPGLDCLKAAWSFLVPAYRCTLSGGKLAIDLQACVFGWVRWSVRRFFYAAPRPEGEKRSRRIEEGVTRATLFCCTFTVGLFPRASSFTTVLLLL
jgi:hypothetical protein